MLFNLRTAPALLLLPALSSACNSEPEASTSGAGGSSSEGSGASSTGSSTGGASDSIDLGSGGRADDVHRACGNGHLDDDEACDDGNQADADGCSADCRQVEPGFVCKPPAFDQEGQICIAFAKCGDGVVAFPEQCDDGSQDPFDGCNEQCKLELGYQCVGEPSICSVTECGDGKVEGTEMCEPDVHEGCTAQCHFAPDCSGDGPCTSACGDGIVLGEQCDDGNTLAGDGCDEACNIEPGYRCDAQTLECERSEFTGECILRANVIYRDFDESHSDFESECAGTGATEGLVESELVGKKPRATGSDMCTSGFDDWYNDTDESTSFPSELVLYDDGEGNFTNRYGRQGEAWSTKVGTYDGHDCTVAPHCGPFDGSPFFFPVDGIDGARGDAISIAEVATTLYGLDGSLYSEEQLTGEGPLHNFSFTSEVTHWFPYDETTNATLKFSGDDDVWVFINNRLALDLGGLHSAISGEVTVRGDDESFVNGTSAEHGMIPGNLYPIKIFHAERHTTGSTFKLTLSGFSPARSSCGGECGNDTVEFGEECDDGPDNKNEYNHCSSECTLGEYCGDGKVTHDEACDDALDPTCNGCRHIVVH